MSQDFLAVAAVQIAADTKLFKEQLAAALESVPKVVPIRIAAVVGSTQAAAKSAKQVATDVAAASTVSTAAMEEESAAAARASVSEQKLTTTRAAASALDKQFAKTEAAIALARLDVIGVTDEQQLAEIKLARQTAAGVAARELLTTAQLHGADVQEILRTEVVKTALAMDAEAASTEREAAAHELAATASRHHAVQVANVGRGSATAALSAVGLRGATLTANAAFIAGAAAAIGFGKAIQTATSFQTNLNVFAATVGATGEQMQKVSATAQQLGKDVTLPGVSAQDAASAMTELAKAGLSVQDSIDGARGVLQLATAAAIDNAQATELTASALNAFGLAGNQAVHVADVLTNAANASQGSITDMGQALGQSASVARQAGLSLETTAAVLTLFARNGLRGSDAGTSLRTALIRLINPTDKAAKIIRQLGLNVRTSTGAIDITVFSQFARATRDLSKAQRDQALAVIFGQDAIRGAAILAREGKGALDQQTAAMFKSGSTAELAAARTKGLAGAIENAKNQAALLGLTLGRVGTGPVQVFITGIANLFSSLDKVAGKIDTFLHPREFDAANANFQELANTAAKLQQQLSTGGFDEFTGALVIGLQQVEKQLATTGAKLAGQGFLTSVIETFKQISPEVKRAMQDNIITPSEQAQLAATGIGRAFIASIPHTAEFFQSFGLSAKSGIEDATAAIKTGGPQISIAMKGTIEDASAVAKVAAAQGAQDTGQAFIKGIQDALAGAKDDVATAFSKALSSARLRTGAFASEQIKLEFQGASPAEIKANLEKKLAVQRTIVADLVARGAKQTNIDLARQNAVQTQKDIESVQAQIDSAAQDAANASKKAAADRVRKAKTVADANTKADQAVLDSLAGGQHRIDLATVDANATARLSDDIALQRLIANTASREIAIISRTVKDAKTRNAAIAERVVTLKAAAAELDRLRQEQVDAAKTKAQNARDLVESTLEKKLQLAQIIGKKDPILAAFNALIENERKNLAAAKKADKLDALIKLQQTIKDRNDFIEGLKKDAADGVKQATTAFDLLKEFSDTFNQNAGNLINPNQPFAGPTGFTADIAQFLIRRQAPQTRPSTAAGKDTSDKLVQSQSSLTEAINRLRDSFEGSVPTNKSTSVRGAATPGGPWHTWNWSARQFQEG